MAWPRAAISRTRSGQARAQRPTRKKVARAPWRSSRASNCGVMAGLGPSSKVRARADVRGVRQTVGPKSCAVGASAAQAAVPAQAAATAGTVMVQGFTDFGARQETSTGGAAVPRGLCGQWDAVVGQYPVSRDLK